MGSECGSPSHMRWKITLLGACVAGQNRWACSKVCFMDHLFWEELLYNMFPWTTQRATFLSWRFTEYVSTENCCSKEIYQIWVYPALPKWFEQRRTLYFSFSFFLLQQQFLSTPENIVLYMYIEYKYKILWKHLSFMISKTPKYLSGLTLHNLKF